MFNFEIPVIVNMMRNIMVVVFEHMEITANIDLDLIIKFTERVLKVQVMNKYIVNMLVCNEMSREYSRGQWTLVVAIYVSMWNLCTWSKQDRLDSRSDPIKREDC